MFTSTEKYDVITCDNLFGLHKDFQKNLSKLITKSLQKI